MRSDEECHMETSCGVVLVNYGTVLLLQYPQGHWDLPKGHVEEGDVNRQATMRRELAEETGIADLVILEGFEERTEYSFRHKGKRQSKEVYWYIAETDEIEVRLSHEHRGYLWLDWDQALDTITHDETRNVVRMAQQFVQLHGTQ
ncbi:diadenosine tetraphosphate hydrolase [Candidatus Woesearchaeota archaeon]|nr:diadenosine tetraphosphate hydrolase [Candidatus Woesearchaeota archaeon]